MRCKPIYKIAKLIIIYQYIFLYIFFLFEYDQPSQFSTHLAIVTKSG